MAIRNAEELETLRRRMQERLSDDAPRVQAFVGRIDHAGPVADGTLHVQFHDLTSGLGHASYWPEWAYRVALEAVLNNAKVIILATGHPLAENLLAVYVSRDF